MKARLVRIAAGCLMASAAAVCAAAQQGVTDKEIVIGDILPLTGPPALLGVAHNLGVKVAVAEAISGTERPAKVLIIPRLATTW